MMSLVNRLSSTFSVTDTGANQFEENRARIEGSVSEAADVLSNERRRWIIGYIAEHGETTLSEMVDDRSREEYGATYSTDERRREYVTMYQTHLSTLEAAGAIEYVMDTRHTIRPGENLDGYIDLLAEFWEVCTAETEVER